MRVPGGEGAVSGARGSRTFIMPKWVDVGVVVTWWCETDGRRVGRVGGMTVVRRQGVPARRGRLVSSLWSNLRSNLRQRAIRRAVVRLSCPATGCWSERQVVGQAPASGSFFVLSCVGGEVVAGCCLQASRGREESEEERGAGCSLEWWMPVSNDSNSRWLQFREGAGRSGAECEQVEEGLRTKKEGRRQLKRKGGQQTGRLNRIPFRWPLPITSTSPRRKQRSTCCPPGPAALSEC